MHPGPGGAVGWVLVVLTVLAAIAYGAAVLRRARPWPRWRTPVLAAALLTAAVVVSPPGRALAHGDDRLHMAAHLLLGMLAPIGIVLAAPGTLLLGAVPLAARRTAGQVLRSRSLHVLTHPAVAGVLDVGGLYVLFLTPLGTSAALAPVADLHVLLAGCLFTWSIAGPDPSPARPSVGVRAVVLIVAGAAHGHLARLLYARAEDAQARAAAELMYYGGDAVELLLAVLLFAAWYRQVRPARGRPPRPVPVTG